MLKLNKIKKSYKTGTFVQHALKEVSLEFRENEFVAVLGPSGSGKTTLLNIIGGLDRYDEGDLIINGKSTKKFKDKEWDAYRNNSVGFIFQSYNLITHISILANVEMGLTLSGVSKKSRKQKATELLAKVGLEDHLHKNPNQLSGGQMQRVAIARALANDPDIILADEPTGALDTKTSTQIMELIKEIAKEKLVIMVTHNSELANEYANRVVEMKDGEIVNDSNPIKDKKENKGFSIRKTAMSFLTALNLSFNNIRTKKGRTALTAFASSIGIIGIALILALSNGFQIEVDDFEKNTLTQSPIIISSQTMQMDAEAMKKFREETKKMTQFPDVKTIYVRDDALETMRHTNIITQEYMDHIEKLDRKHLSSYAYQKVTNFIVINDQYKQVDVSGNPMMSTSAWELLPTSPNNDFGVIDSFYDIIAGKIDGDVPGLVLQVDNYNRISSTILQQFGFEETDKISFEDLMNKELKVVLNNDYYGQIAGNFIPNQDLESLYSNKNNITVKVQAIIRGKKGKELITNNSGVMLTEGLLNRVVEANKNSDIVKAQEKADYNILTHQAFEEEGTNTKEMMLGYLGAESLPVVIYLYPRDFDSKDAITTHLDKYNKGKEDEATIIYNDMA